MTTSLLKLQTPANSPLGIKVYCTEESFNFSSQNFNLYKNRLEQLLNHPMSGFQHLNEFDRMIADCLRIKKQFQDRIQLVHIGIGGSVLGAEVLISAFAKVSPSVTFLNNLDADDIEYKLQPLNLKKCLFYVVSKSGSTLETQIMMDIVLQKLSLEPSLQQKTRTELLQEYFVFATDPVIGPLRKMANEHQINCLEIPSNLGGRFCAFSVVTFFPALFQHVNLQEFCDGAKKVKNFFMYQDNFKILLQIAIILFNDHERNKRQTVLMPYSSQLKSFTHWFAQLWGESLGKNNRGLTPIVAHGPADQHSLLQLFVDGPKDKDFIFLKIHQTQKQFLNFHEEYLKDKNLSHIVHAQLEGTMASLQKNNATLFLLEIDQLSSFNLGSLMFFFEFLTVATGAVLSIDPYDQPGVETGKILTKSILEDGKSHLLN